MVKNKKREERPRKKGRRSGPARRNVLQMFEKFGAELAMMVKMTTQARLAAGSVLYRSSPQERPEVSYNKSYNKLKVIVVGLWPARYNF